MVIHLPDWQTSLAAAISALAIALAIGNQIFEIASAARKRHYLTRKKGKRRREREAASFVARAIPLPTSNKAPYLKLGIKLAEWIKPLHERAKIEQDKYYNALIRSLSSIAIGFIMLAANQVIFTNSMWFGLFTNWLDMFAVGITLYAFIQASRYNRQWIISRIQTELMRQRSVLIALKYIDLSAARDRWLQEVVHLDKLLSKSNSENDLEEAVRSSSLQFRNELARLDADNILIDMNFVRAYLHVRVLSQLRW